MQYSVWYGHAIAGIAAAGLHHGVEARRGVGRIEVARIAAPGHDAREIRDLQNVGDVRAPGERIAVDAPVVGDQPDRSEDGAGVARTGSGVEFIKVPGARHG